MKTKEQAKQAASKAKAMMKEPDKWKIDVWENIGWHFHLVRHTITIYPSYDGEFRSLMTLEECDVPSGHPPLCTNFSSKNPQEVYEVQLRHAKECLSRLEYSIHKILSNHSITSNQ